MQVFNRHVSGRGLTVFGFETLLISGSILLAAQVPVLDRERLQAGHARPAEGVGDADADLVAARVGRLVAKDHEVGRLPLDVADDFLERREAAVNVGEDRYPHVIRRSSTLRTGR